MTEEHIEMPTTEAIQMVLIANLQRRKRWGEKPEMGMLVREQGVLQASEIRISEITWEKFNKPGALLDFLKQIAVAPETEEQKNYASALKGQFKYGYAFGLYLRHEGWTIPQAVAERYYAAIKAGRKVPMIKDLKERIECRIINAVDSQGRSYIVSSQRGQLGTTVLTDGENPGDSLGGEHVHSLRSAVRSLSPRTYRKAIPGEIPNTFRAG